MRWFAILACLLVLTGSARAAGPDDRYLDIYNEILQADTLRQNGQSREAAEKYLDAQSALKRLKDDSPNWNTAIVSFRLDYLADQLAALRKFLPSANPPAAQAAPAPVQPAAAPAPSALDVAALRQQIGSLTAANTELENKLKEALSVQPAAVSPVELAKAQEKIVALQKEKDLLSVALEQAKAATPPSAQPPENNKTAGQLAEANKALAAAQEKIATDATEIDALKAARPDNTKELAAERDKLKEELASRTKDMADAEAHRDEGVTDLRAKLAQAVRERDELKAKLESAPASAPAAAADAQVDQLRARLAVLEAQAVPYTPEELAMMKETKTPASEHLPAPGEAQASATPAEGQRIAHSMKDLPPGAGPLMAEANRDTMERDYTKAQEKYEEVLHQDENNVYVLAHLASAQLALSQLDQCQKTLDRSLALDKDDPASLYTLGVLRLRQQRIDDAVDALSLSAKYDPTNDGTQYYLGDALASKGLRYAAETAFRKALEIRPDYADAHYGLAWVYASEKPPSLGLARWHYQKAVDLGHDKSPELEKVLTP